MDREIQLAAFFHRFIVNIAYRNASQVSQASLAIKSCPNPIQVQEESFGRISDSQ